MNGYKFTQEYRSLEEQSLRLFTQDVDLLKQRQEYEATGGYAKPIELFSNSWKGSSLGWGCRPI